MIWRRTGLHLGEKAGKVQREEQLSITASCQQEDAACYFKIGSDFMCMY